MKHAFFALTFVLALSSAAMADDARVGADGRSLGTLQDAIDCPYIDAIQHAAPGSFEAMILKISKGGEYTKRSPSNYLGMYQFSEAALQACVMSDGNPLNNNYGADLVTTGVAPSDVLNSYDLERWRSTCEVETDVNGTMHKVTANITNSEDFLANPCLQEAMIRKELLDARAILRDPQIQDVLCTKIVGKYTIEHNQSAGNLGTRQDAGVFLTPSGIIYGTHILGARGLKEALRIFLEGGEYPIVMPRYGADHKEIVTSAPLRYPAGTILTDGNDIPWTARIAAANYFAIPDLANYIGKDDPWCKLSVDPGEVRTWQEANGVVSLSTHVEYTPPVYAPGIPTTDYPYDKAGDIPTLPEPPKSAKAAAHEIFKAADVPNKDIAENPSYYELREAVTRKKFIPTFYTNLADDEGAIAQKLAVVEADISIEFKDIYDMQKIIASLLAQRAALQSDSSPGPAKRDLVPKN